MDSEMAFIDLADAIQIVLDPASLQLGNTGPHAHRTIAGLDDATKREAMATVEDFAVHHLGDD